MAITRSFKGLWVETWVPLPTHTHSAFSCPLLYSTVKRKKKKKKRKRKQPPQTATCLYTWASKEGAKCMLKRQEEAVGTLQETNTSLLVRRRMFTSHPPATKVKRCFSKTSFISKRKRSVNRRQNWDVCTLHPQQIKLTLSSRNAPFFALLPFHSTLLAVRRAYSQLQPDESTSQMKAPRHPHAAETHTSHCPSPYVGREICPWQEHQTTSLQE